jgi:CYTH domain-containing protein
LDEKKRRELDRMLVSIDSLREIDRSSERGRRIERNRQVYRFEELMRSVVVPTLRLCMAHLDRKGHFTRLRALSPRRARLDLQVHLSATLRGALELALIDDHPDQLRVDYAWGWKREQEVFPVDQLGETFVADRVLHLLRGLVKSPVESPRPPG